ncbi:hypothetical protein AB0C59_28390 [Streptomyces sp. NPDC048664]|uniref:hypothetical protein n=1 Tax=Streptomyces sp. NPDC048664 TaxID=3154505 RepID=UPI00343A90A3
MSALPVVPAAVTLASGSGMPAAGIVVRDTNGSLYRNDGDGKGSFGARTRIATGWGGYRALS